MHAYFMRTGNALASPFVGSGAELTRGGCSSLTVWSTQHLPLTSFFAIDLGHCACVPAHRNL